MSVLVWIEQTSSGTAPSSWEVLGKSRELADALRTQLVAVVIGVNTDAASEAASVYGADVVYTITDRSLATYRLSAYGTALLQAAHESEATVLLTGATTRGRELSAHLACALEAGLAPDAVDLRIEDGKLVAVRSIFSNNLLADIIFESDVQVASVRPRSFAPPEPGDGSADMIELSLGLSENEILEKVLSSQSSGSGEIRLSDANIIVSGGRGVARDPELGFELVGQLASVLGGAVGASRAAVDAGYVPYSAQVGQTGKTVRPDLYIAAGISGAIQHMAGMGSSRIIVAINQDGTAPIFEKANYGVVGDLFEILPALVNELRNRLE